MFVYVYKWRRREATAVTLEVSLSKVDRKRWRTVTEQHFAFVNLLNSVCIKRTGRVNDWCLDLGSKGD